jgi:hypothetical protein
MGTFSSILHNFVLFTTWCFLAIVLFDVRIAMAMTKQFSIFIVDISIIIAFICLVIAMKYKSPLALMLFRLMGFLITEASGWIGYILPYESMYSLSKWIVTSILDVGYRGKRRIISIPSLLSQWNRRTRRNLLPNSKPQSSPKHTATKEFQQDKLVSKKYEQDQYFDHKGQKQQEQAQQEENHQPQEQLLEKPTKMVQKWYYKLMFQSVN